MHAIVRMIRQKQFNNGLAQPGETWALGGYQHTAGRRRSAGGERLGSAGDLNQAESAAAIRFQSCVMAHGWNRDTLVLAHFKDGLALSKIDLPAIDRHRQHLLHESDLQIRVKVVAHKSPESALSLDQANSVYNGISGRIYQEKNNYAINASLFFSLVKLLSLAASDDIY